MSISNPEVKKLYGLSAGRCNICKKGLFENEVHIGQMAHVIGRSVDGPRGRDVLGGDRDSYENLILLCANHHIEVDQNTEAYPVNRLLEIKQSHEYLVASQFEHPKERLRDINFINLFMEFVPFTRLQSLTHNLPSSINLDFSLVGDMFEALTIDNPHLYPLNDPELNQKFNNFIQAYFNLWNVISGYSEVEGRHQANFSQATERMNIHMEKIHLPYDVVTLLIDSIGKLNSDFVAAYLELTDFLRKNYKEVNLSSYRKP
ncbi:hypothetical protein CLV44_1207 [Marinobacterium halophilum]|uniref:HNH endonuclease n=1 Tax=Marinobacterium halophilum TaxID=267374 RepID=A0A2P8ERF0_9GAMM|nr:HNH endonuclease signature motif containing protein [Marinobacterium halophilum]PSL12023.1 hypothetical protein CLV44_1207 [Marinobacterium halophilum]